MSRNQAGAPASGGGPGASATGRCSVQLWENRQARLLKRARRRTDLAALEQLESRELLAFSTLGFSLPDLTITGQAGPRAAWGGVLQRLGDSCKTSARARSRSRSRSCRRPRRGRRARRTARRAPPMRPTRRSRCFMTQSPKSIRGAVTLGTISAPPISQNSVEQLADFVHASGTAGGISRRRRQVLRLVRGRIHRTAHWK